MTEKPITKRQQKANATRAKVVKAAARLFAKSGFLDVTIRNVADAAGVSTGAIFSHFTGKDDLFEGATGRKPPLDSVRTWLSVLAQADNMSPNGAAARELLIDLFGEA